MDKKKVIVIAAVCALAVAGAVCGLLLKDNNVSQDVEHPEISNKVQHNNHHSFLKRDTNKNTSIDKKEKAIQAETINQDKTKTANLYDGYPSSMIPLSGIAELSDLTPTALAALTKIFDNSNCIYMIKRNGNKLFMVVDAPENIRHGVDFIELDIKNGHQVTTTLGYNDKMQDSDNEIWEYDKKSNEQLPTRHVKYNKDGDVEFVENWYYDDSPIKYEMKDRDGTTISIKKETVDNGTDMRVEHLVYDKNGNTKINVTASYEGDDIKRFTYYNADKLSDSASVFGEYKDGQKIKETVYTSDLKVKNLYKAAYEDGARTEITVFDSNENEMEKLVPKKSE